MDNADNLLDRNCLLRPRDVLHIREGLKSLLPHSTQINGMVSSRYYNKWKETGLVPMEGEKVKSPTILQSPLSLECKIKSIIHLGTHDMLLSEIVNVRVDSKYVDQATGKLTIEKANLLAYTNGLYQGLGPVIGSRGFSIKNSEPPKPTEEKGLAS